MEQRSDPDAFRFLVTGHYKFVNAAMEVCDGHYLCGALFTTNTLSPAPAVFSSPRTEGDEFFILGDYIVQTVYLDPWNEFRPLPFLSAADLPEGPGLSPVVSADGIPIFTPGVSFAISIVGNSTMSSTSEFEGKLVFGSDNFTQGVDFEADATLGVLRSGLSGDYLVLGETFELTPDEPTEPIGLVPVGRESMFVVRYGGVAGGWYKIDFVKASYGEATRVDALEGATVFQLICPGVIENANAQVYNGIA